MKTFFDSLSISKKLAVVFVLLLFMMGVGGFVGLYNANQLAKATESLYTNSFKRIETLNAVENEFLSARQAKFLHTIISDDASRSFLKSSIEEHRSKIDRLLDDYKAMGIAEGKEIIYEELTHNMGSYWVIHARVETLSVAGRREEALSLIRLEGNKTFTDTLNSIRKLIEEEKFMAYASYRASDFFAILIISVTLALTVIAIVLVGALWLALTRSIVRPILAIEESAKKIGHGNLKERVPVMTEDEIGNLAIEFNRMADGIENYYATLEKKVSERTDEIAHTNDELLKKKQELELANMELAEANKMKSQFLANVSHELRTPLNSIIGFSELLQEKAFGDLNERQHQYVDYVHSSGQHLLQLINNILDLSKIEAGRMELVQEDFPIMEVLGEALGIVRPMAHKKDVKINSKSVPASPKLRADKAKFKQIMLNLLSNAIKFNSDGGVVTVGWEISVEPFGMKMTRYLTFMISDTGIGIKDEDREKLFKEFGQLDSSATREYGGTGLGLALTKRLVELHNGGIWFESAEGKGTTFYVKLPQGTDEIDMPDVSKARDVPSWAGGPAHCDKHPLVLVAGESSDINHLLEIYLSGGRYDFITAADGAELLQMAKTHSQGGDTALFAIITGVAIPKMDGWEVLKGLKADPTTSGVPVIVISSTDNKDLGYALGAAEYMEKPVNRDALLNALDRIRATKP
ncbi:MAG: MCP four helix bundle domain-containing protein [Deltaproteobacteria bacterium]|nr:MCP four helix bundle domain-containing protein [Deltaproteobacteria bacterium]